MNTHIHNRLLNTFTHRTLSARYTHTWDLEGLFSCFCHCHAIRPEIPLEYQCTSTQYSVRVLLPSHSFLRSAFLSGCFLHQLDLKESACHDDCFGRCPRVKVKSFLVLVTKLLDFWTPESPESMLEVRSQNTTLQSTVHKIRSSRTAAGAVKKGR